MTQSVALVRAVSPTIADCQLTHLDRVPLDFTRARSQHACYVQALRELGCRVEEVENDDSYPDSVFIEDTAVVVDEIAVVTRPGSSSRRGETHAVANKLQDYRSLATIEPPGTLDGGDVLRIGQRVFVGVTSRTNASGITQLTDLLSPFGYQVTAVPLRDTLHLKTAATAIADDTILLHSPGIVGEPFAEYRCLEIDPREPFSANALRIGDSLVYPDNFPATRAILETAAFRVKPVPADELAKAEGGVTCCSVVFAE